MSTGGTIPPLAAGQVLGGRFRLETLLGEGSFGSVWRAATVENIWGDRYALKILHPRLLAASWIRDRFTREAEISSTLKHPNIARAVAWSTEPPYPFLALEYVEGTTLFDLLAKGVVLERYLMLEELETLTKQLFAAVAYAHQEKIVHRDLKPKNIMVLRKDGATALKVLDFGISKVLATTGDGTTVGRILGSPAYMAPEQIQSAEVDPRTDVFALGSVLFEMLTLKRAWLPDEQRQSGATAQLELFQRIMSAPRPKPTMFRPELPEALDEVIAKATAIEPHARYASVAALAEAFAEALHASTFEEESTAGEATAPLLTRIVNEAKDPAGDFGGATDTRPLAAVPQVPVPGQVPVPVGRATGMWIAGGIAFAGAITAAMFGTVSYLESRELPVVAAVTPVKPAPAPKIKARPQEAATTTATVADTASATTTLVAQAIPAEAPKKQRPILPVKPAAETIAPKDPRTQHLDELLAKSKSQPTAATLVGELEAAIQKSAQTISDATKRTAFERRATASAAVGDLAGLTALARELKTELEKK